MTNNIDSTFLLLKQTQEISFAKEIMNIGLKKKDIAEN